MVEQTGQTPIVSVVIAVHNGKEHLPEAVEGVLRQTLGDLELIIVDDGSTDGTAEYLRSLTDPRVRVITNERNLGVYKSRNRGNAAARGEFLAVHDHDDVSSPDRLEKQAAFLRANPDHVAVSCWFTNHRTGKLDSITRDPSDDLSARWHMLFRTPLPHQGLMMRRSAFERLGGYDDSQRCAMDGEIECRLAQIGKLCCLPEPLLDVYLREGGITVRRSEEQRRICDGLSRKQMEMLLGADALPDRLRDLADRVLYMGKVPDRADLRDALSFSIRLGRRFAEVHNCPEFLSDTLEPLFTKHLHLAWQSIGKRDYAQAMGHARVALAFGRSGLLKRPLRTAAQLAWARIKERLGRLAPTRRRRVLVHVRTFGKHADVAVSHHVEGLRRYRAYVVAHERENLDLFRYRWVYVLDHPNPRKRRLFRFLFAVRHFHLPSPDEMRAWRFKRFARMIKPHLVHAHSLSEAVLAAPIAQDCRVPLVVTAHGHDVDRARRDEQFRRRLVPVFEGAARVIAVSDVVADKLIKIGCPADKIERIYPGVPIPTEAAEVTAPSERINIAAVALAATANERQPLLEAFAHALRRQPGLFLTVVSERDLIAGMRPHLERLGIADKVELKLLSDPEIVPQILARSQIHACYNAHVGEAAPLAHMETVTDNCIQAAGLGLPIVAVRTGAIPEICRHEHNGYLVAEGDLEGMAERIVQLARDPRLRAQLGKNGRALVQLEFNLNQQLRKIEELYDQVSCRK